MSRVFAISAATDQVRLGKQREGEISFTVTNTSGRRLRGRARAIADAPDQEEWFSVVGDKERQFSPDTTDQIIVKVTPPPGAVPGQYRFSLDMISVDNPDEDFTEGPQISFEVKPSEPERKPFPWWIVAVIAGVLVVGSLIGYLLTRSDEPPPAKPAPPEAATPEPAQPPVAVRPAPPVVVARPALVRPSIALYEHVNFVGRSSSLGTGKFNMAELGLANDSLSSLRIPSGMRARLFEHHLSQGASIELRKDTPSLVSLGWNDRVSSMWVYPAVTVMIFQHANFQGASRAFPPGRFDMGELGIGNDQLSSVKVPSGMSVTLYEHARFGGAAMRLTGDSGFVGNAWNDRVSSIEVKY